LLPSGLYPLPVFAVKLVIPFHHGNETRRRAADRAAGISKPGTGCFSFRVSGSVPAPRPAIRCQRVS
jgi:hypothetical protein